MAKPFGALRAKLGSVRIAQNKAKADEIIAKVALQDLRRSLNITQEELARALKVKQSSVSKLESQDDMYISTLIRVVGALGGELRLVASFPKMNKEVILEQFKGRKASERH